jgi:hypothetical protein
MKDEFEDLMGALSGASLSEREKDSIRARLRGFMDTYPARAPFSVRMLDAFSAIAGMSVLQMQRRSVQFSAAALALVLVAGTGVAYAAGSALPGEPLYGVKVNIEEPIQGAFATSAQAQAEWGAQLATRRLAEAETLAAQNKLTPQAISTVTSGLDQATEQFDANVAQIATSSGNAAIAANLESNMEATLAANTQVLSQIQSAVPSAAHSIAPLLSRVRTRTIAVDEARTHLDVAAAETDATEGELNAENAIVTLSAATSATGTEQVSNDAGAATLATVQTAALDAKVVQLHQDIADQLQSATGLDLPPATTSATTTATGAIDTSLNASSTTIDGTSTDYLNVSHDGTYPH